MILSIYPHDIKKCAIFVKKTLQFVMERGKITFHEQCKEVESLPNIKSAKKRVEIGKVREMRNKARKSFLRTTLKRFDLAVKEGDKAQIDSAYQLAVKTVDKSASKGILHKNNAARKKSSLAHKLNQAG